MPHNKQTSKKRHLAKHAKRTKWAPFWLIPKVFGMGKRVHPARITRIKRNWRRSKLHIKPRRFKPGHLG
jgi:ribosomal protein L39E